MNIFVSHSSKDEDLASLFVTLLTDVLKIDSDFVYCSSIDGHKNDSGANWKEVLKESIQMASLSFSLITENYLDSEVCLCELGGLYFNPNNRLIPLLVSKGDIERLEGELWKELQAEHLLDSASLERLKELVTADQGTTIKADIWDQRKRKFLSEAATLAAPQKHGDDDNRLRRGFHSDFIVDSTISHHDKTSNIELAKQLEHELRNDNDRTIDLKYNYLGASSAANWITLSKHPGYGHSKLIKFISENASEIVNQLELEPGKTIDFISLGSGDGEIDKHLLFQLITRNNLNVFYPFDISFDLLQKVVNEVATCTWWQDKPKIKAIHGDFLELVNYRRIFDHDNVPNCFSLLGFTFGNYSEGNFIGKIKEGMRKGDYLLLDARLHDLKLVAKITNEDKEKITANYNNQSANRFVFAALETVTNADYKSVTFENVPSQHYTDVPNAVNVLVNCKGVNARFRSDNKPFRKDTISLGLTTLYSFEDLVTWLGNKGFNVIYEKQVDGNGFILLRKK